jgi:hypothetical protein
VPKRVLTAGDNAKRARAVERLRTAIAQRNQARKEAGASEPEVGDLVAGAESEATAEPRK